MNFINFKLIGNKIISFVKSSIQKMRSHIIPIIVVSAVFCTLIVVLLFTGLSRKNSDTISLETVSVDLAQFWTISENISYIDMYNIDHINQSIQSYEITAEYVDGVPVEIVYLGDTGILGSRITLENIETEWQIDNNKLSGDTVSDNTVSGNELSASAVLPNVPVYTPNPTATPSPSEEPSEEPNGTPEPSAIPNGEEPTPTGEDYDPQSPENQTPITNNAAFAEYVTADNSVQGLNYVIYCPANVTADTPIFLFLHGVGENGASYDRFIGTFGFLKHLINGSWQPNFIVVAPIMVSGSNWVKQQGNISALLGEVVSNYGGNTGNMYIGGFSAGADAITPLAKTIDFQGAIYMAGYMGGSGNTTDAASLLSLWSGKRIFYFRDSFYSGGGYGYNADYVNSVRDLAANYSVDFIRVDMDYGHVSSMIDAVFLPSYFMDSKQNYCHDAINDLIY